MAAVYVVHADEGVGVIAAKARVEFVALVDVAVIDPSRIRA